MRGIGDKLERQTKIKILQQRATKYNEQFDQLEEQGKHPDDIRTQISSEQYSKRHQNDKNRTLPFDENQKVIKLAGGLDFGFENSHKQQSSTKQMMNIAESNFQDQKKLKQTGKPNPNADLFKRAKEQDEKMKKKIYQDHLAEMYSGEDFKKEPNKSNYQQNYEFNENFQKECDNQDFSHHMLKNDLKWYAETYQRYKTTMRGGK